MSGKTEQTVSEDQSAAEAAEQPVAAESPEPAKTGGSTAVKRPRRRSPRPDALIAESVELARTALAEEFPGEAIGEHAGVSVDDERVMTHRFEGSKRGYRGWQWYATLARAPRAKKVTVCELGLLPAEDALLAPEWVPWSDRVRPEDSETPAEGGQGHEAQDGAAQDGGSQGEDAQGRDAQDQDAQDQDAQDQDAQQGGEHGGERDESAAPAEQDGQPDQGEQSGQAEQAEKDGPDEQGESSAESEHDPSAAEIEASVSVKRRPRRRRYRTRSRA